MDRSSQSRSEINAQPIARWKPARMSAAQRLVSALAALGCLAVLIAARSISPDARGTGTHTQLGLQACQFKYRTGLPCGTCGMTTSFSHFARGQIGASIWIQPFGFLLAVGSAMTFWAAGYCAVTARPAYRILRRWSVGLVTGTLLMLWILSWGWKIWLVVSGRDGWR